MAQIRKDQLVNDHSYHIFTRSISKFVIFNNGKEYQRMLKLIDLYRYQNFTYRFSNFHRMSELSQKHVLEKIRKDNNVLVEIIAYCLMPTHIHLILKQKTKNGISKFISRVLNGYSRYFNTIHQRTGPLWSGRFKSVLIENDEQLLHLTRYLHLNPTSAGLIKNINKWNYSSYFEYIKPVKNKLCNYRWAIGLKSKEYQKFVEDRKDLQKQISLMKHLIIEEYVG